VLMLFNLGSVNMKDHFARWYAHLSRGIETLLRICGMS
jgi:hypothetical protein